MSELYMTENPPQSKKITAGSVKKPKIVMFTTVGKNRQRRQAQPSPALIFNITRRCYGMTIYHF